MQTAAILLAAGSGTRMGAGENKLFLPLADATVLEHTVRAFQASPLVDAILLVGKEAERDALARLIPRRRFDKLLGYVSGGAERQDSVLCGLEALPESYARVLIHDGARPFVTPELLEALLGAVTPACGAVAAVPVKDTIKEASADRLVTRTPERSRLWQVQTPQCFYTGAILRCYRAAERDGCRATDDASLAERYGLAVRLVPAYYENIKLTTPEDMAVAEVFLQRLRAGRTVLLEP